MSIDISKTALNRSEIQIESSLIAKGQILTQNNSEALKGMVEDNAFSAIQTLVASTVEADADILFGTFMDMDSSPWVMVTPDNLTGLLQSRETLKDENSVWVSTLTVPSVKLTKIDGLTVYLFAAPVSVDDEILGFIQYALSTKHMLTTIAEARLESEKALVRTILSLLILGFITGILSFIAVRRMAIKISSPLKTLKEAADTISSGNYSTSVNIESNDEIGMLSLNFDTMRTTIQKKIKDLGELNALGQTLSVIETERDLFRIALINSHVHSLATFSCIYAESKQMDMESQCQYPESGDTNEWTEAIQRLLAEGKLHSNTIETHDIPIGDSKQIAILVPFLAGEKTIATMLLCGPREEIILSDSDHEYYQSLSQMVLVSKRNINLKQEIEQHNLDLEVTIKERTAALQEKTNDISNMMENMHQGLFTITADGTIHQEYAKFLEQIFDTPNIAGSDAMDLLFSRTVLGDDKKDQISAVLGSLIGSDEMMFDFNSHLLVPDVEIRSLDLNPENSKFLELDWDPITSDGDISKIMVTVRDVSAIKVLEVEAAEQKIELEIIGQILAIDSEKFENFIDSSLYFVDRNRILIESTQERSTDVINELFRNMHTIKGNARTYGFIHITDSVHAAETFYDRLRSSPSKSWRPGLLLSQLDAVQQSLDLYENTNTNVLKRGEGQPGSVGKGKIVIDQTTLSAIQSQITSLLDENLSKVVYEKLDAAKTLLGLMDASRLEDVLEDVCLSTRSLAKELGKPEPVIEINAEGFVIRNDSKELFNNVCMHNFRNSLDHGIETAEVREANGKSPEGHIILDASIQSNTLEMRIYDDGQGISLKKIKEKALANGDLPQGEEISNQRIADCLFIPGMSTAETLTNISGRGVGMDAVKRFIEESGGEVGIQLKETASRDDNKKLDLVPFELLIKLPQSTFIQQTSKGTGTF